MSSSRWVSKSLILFIFMLILIVVTLEVIQIFDTSSCKVNTFTYLKIFQVSTTNLKWIDFVFFRDSFHFFV